MPKDELKEEPNENTVDVASLSHWELDQNNLAASIVDRLFWGIAKNKCAFVESGLAAGVKITDVYNEQGYSPLTLAARWDALAMVSLLLERGLDPSLNGVRDAQFNALHAGAKGNSINIINFLLSKSPYKIGERTVVLTIDTTDANKQTPLHHAINENHFSLAMRLIEQHNASLEIGDFRGRNAFAFAIGCLFLKPFDTGLRANNRVQEWEDFCIFLLKKQNPFAPSAKGAASHFIAPIQALLTPHTGFDQMKMPLDRRYDDRQATTNAMIKLFMFAPMFAALLYMKALENPSGEYENTFKALFEEVKLNKPNKTTKKSILTQAEVDQVEQYLKALQSGKPLQRPAPPPTPPQHASISTHSSELDKAK